ncbi:MAG: DinB family protein [Ignavibacteriaceae bacterium]
MENEFNKIFEYNYWANSKLVSSLKEQNIVDVNILRLFSHIVLSEQIWILRIEGADYSNKKFWQILTLEECEMIINENHEKFNSLLSKLDPSEYAAYENSKGIKYTNSVHDILTHVSFHSAYHRGQIAKEVRRLNKQPVVTDYIAFIRDKHE